MTTINLAESQNLPFYGLPRLYFLRFAIIALHLSRVLYKFTFFMQNKPNFPRFWAKNSYLEEKQTQFKPNLQNAQMNITSINTMNYEL